MRPCAHRSRNASTSSTCFFECPDEAGKNRPTARITRPFSPGVRNRTGGATQVADRPHSRSTQGAVYGEFATMRW